VRLAEFPVLFRIVDAREEAPALLLLGEMQEELDDAGAVAVQVALESHDGLIALIPDGLSAAGIRQSFPAQDLGVHAHDEHLLVVRAVEDSDLAALGQIARGTPEEVVLEFGGARMLEAEHIATLRIHTRHYVRDDPVLA